MPHRDIFVIGASTGGVPALQRLVRALPDDFPGTLFVVIHLAPHSESAMPHILARAGALPAANARHEEKFLPGRIYVAPVDRHLLLAPGDRMLLGHGPRENRFRPAIDPLFRSAALHYGRRSTGIVLTGALDDGTAGLCAIKQSGGLAVVQDPRDAEVSSMPASAMRHVKVDFCCGLDGIATLLPKLASESFEAATTPSAPSEETRLAVAVAADEGRREPDIAWLGKPSSFTCPECHGSLFQLRDMNPLRFRCHTGHAFTAASLEADLRDNIETASWKTIRALQEHAMLLDSMADASDTSDEPDAGLRERAERALRQADLVRRALAQDAPDTHD